MANSLVRHGPQPPQHMQAQDLDRQRRRNDQRLKGTFEHIFDKYTKDFSNVGDEIDLETGRIVVNNGHLARMQHEKDVGASASSRYPRTITNGHGDNSSQGRAPTHDESDLDERLDDHRRLAGAPQPNGTSVGYETESEEDEGNTADHDGSSDSEEQTNRGSHRTSVGQEAVAITTGILGSAFQDSLHRPGNSQPLPNLRVDPAAIEALGQNIANQIAQFLTQHVHPALPANPSNPWTAPPLPSDFQRSSHQQRPLPSLSPSPAPMGLHSPNTGHSLWALPDAAEHGRPSKRRRLYQEPQGNVVHSIRTSDEDDIGGAPADGAQFPQQSNKSPQILAQGVQHPRPAPPEGERDYSSDEERLRRRGFSGYMPRKNKPHAKPYIPRRFTTKEDLRIKELKERYGLKWTEIAEKMPGRTANSISSRYRSRLQNLSQIPGQRYIKREVIEIQDDEDENAVVFGSSTVSQGTPQPSGQTPLSQYSRPPIPPSHTPSSQRPRRQNKGAWMTGPAFAHNTDHVPYEVPGDYERYTTPSAQVPPTPTGSEQSGFRYPRPGVSQPWNHQQPYYAQQPYPVNQSPAQPSEAETEAEQHVRHVERPATDDVPRRGPGRPRKVVDPDYVSPPKQMQPRYRTFDNSQGDGRFGVLRTNQRVQNQGLIAYAAEPRQEQMLGPLTERTGTYGVLRTGKPKKAGSPKEKTPQTRQSTELQPEQRAPAPETSLIDREASTNLPPRESQKGSQWTLTGPHQGSQWTLFVPGDSDSDTSAPARESQDAPRHPEPSNSTHHQQPSNVLEVSVGDKSTTPLPVDALDEPSGSPSRFFTPRGITATPAPERIVPNSSPLAPPTLTRAPLVQGDGKEASVVPTGPRSSPRKTSSQRSSVTRKSFRSPMPRKNAEPVSSVRSVRTRPIPIPLNDEGSDDELA